MGICSVRRASVPACFLQAEQAGTLALRSRSFPAPSAFCYSGGASVDWGGCRHAVRKYSLLPRRRLDLVAAEVPLTRPSLRQGARLAPLAAALRRGHRRRPLVSVPP